MCGIAGFCDFTQNLKNEYTKNKNIVIEMGKTLEHRGPNASGNYISEHVAFAHTRLAVIDLLGGIQPMKRTNNGHEYVIIYNGELYNTEEVRKELKKRGYEFHTTSDTEVLLVAYIEYGTQCPNYFNGIFSFAIWDSFHRLCFLCRDRFGVKPLFYSIVDQKVVFGSEIKALFEYPSIHPIINQYGLCEIFGLGPARSPGCGVYEGIHEVKPGHAAIIDYSGMILYSYWSLTAMEHTDNYEQTVEKTREILLDAIKRQLISDVPICTLLSGGLDSSVVSAVAANALKEEGKKLDTYSFDYNDNTKYFKASSFQPTQDRPFVDIMVNAIDSNHTYLECDHNSLYEYLYDAVIGKDLPGMADVDSSMLYFCRQIKKNHTVCLSGECADEIFGGYPWFRDEEAYNTNTFPWSKNLDYRKSILSPHLRKILPMDEYVQSEYQKTIRVVPRLDGESKLATRQREISYLNTSWFMTTLLDRKDRMTMASGLEVRVPYADHRLIQYLYNVPWEYKYHNNEVKALLKDAVKGILPDKVINRKKSPYPKTYDPQYESLLKDELRNILRDDSAPIHILVDHESIHKLMDSNSDYGRPWFGQLMATPQLYAYLIQINFWLKHYKVTLKI